MLNKSHDMSTSPLIDNALKADIEFLNATLPKPGLHMSECITNENTNMRIERERVRDTVASKTPDFSPVKDTGGLRYILPSLPVLTPAVLVRRHVPVPEHDVGLQA